MHHSGGAYSETQEIYGDPLREALGFGARSVISVGLGLGYNEILVAAEALANKISASDFSLLTFESEDILKEHFLAWLSSSENDFIYDRITEFFENAFGLSGSDLKNWLKQALANGNWLLVGALQADFRVERKYEVIFYDAFSSQSAPQLWDEEFLARFFMQVSARQALVCTYACTGSLKRALKKAGFDLVLKKGFKGKRNSTLGIRGWPARP